MLENIRESVFRANLDLVKHGLVIHSWGNVSGRDPETGYIVIKPSGVTYEKLRADDMVVVDLSGKIIEGRLNPSTDTPTHLLLYRKWPEIGGIVHTHSTCATAWAQAGRNIPPLGTTHADTFYGEIPCTRKLKSFEVKSDYEINTGRVIVERLGPINPLHMPSVLVFGHGPFSWGTTPEEAVYNAVTLEEVARMALYTILLGRNKPVEKHLLDKHFLRKHGKKAYYGQSKN